MADDRPRSGEVSRRGVIGLVAAVAGCGALVRVCRAAEPPFPIESIRQLETSNIPWNVERVSIAERDNAIFVTTEQAGLDPTARGSTWAASNSGERAWQILPLQIMTPEMFGIVEDGRGDATGPVDVAIGFLAKHGGGTLRFHTGKTYRFASSLPETAISNPAHTSSIGLPADSRNLIFDLNGATLLQACDAYTFGAKYRPFNDSVMRRTVIPLAGPLPRRGGRTVRVAHASGFTRGDTVMLVSRNVGPKAYTPVAEMLVIESVDGTTVRFTEPFAKDHESDGRNPVGLINLSGNSIRDCTIVGPGTIINDRRRCGNVFQVIGFRMSNVRCEGRGGMAIRGRHILVEDCVSIIQADWSAPLYRPYAIAFDTGTSDAIVRNLIADGNDNLTYIHLHEGLADIVIDNVRIRNGTRYDPRGSGVAALSILGTSWNVKINNVTIVNNPEGPGIAAREFISASRGNHDLTIRNVRLQGHFRGRALLVRDREPAIVEDIDLVDVTSGNSDNPVLIEGTDHRVQRVVRHEQ